MILQKIIAGIMAVFFGITGIFSANQRVSYLEDRVNELESQLELTSAELMESESVILGAFYPLGGKRYKLAGSGVGTTDTSVELQSLTMPISDRELTMTDFGEVGYATMDPGNPSKKEFISFTGITQSGSSDKATLTGVSRGLSFVTPYSASTTLRSSHSGGSSLIFSNSPAFYSEFAIKRNDQDITGTWTFDSDALPEVDDSTYTPTDNAQIIWKKYADDLTNAGAADATISVKGIIEIATIQDVISMAAASSSDTTAMIVVPTYYFATTSQATTSVVVTHTDGKIDQNFIDLTEAYAWTGEHIFSATNTMATTTFNGDLTVSGEFFIVSASSTMATTTFSVIPHIPNATPTDAFHIASKDYVDNKTIRKGYQSLVRAYSGLGTQDLGTATWAKVQLNKETTGFDPLNEFDSGANYRFTAASTGFYHVIGSVMFSPGAVDQSCQLQIRVNNGEATSTILSFAAVNSAFVSNLSDYFSLTAGDYVELWGYTAHADAVVQNSTSSTYIAVSRVY